MASTDDYAESKHVDVTSQAGAENCLQVFVSPEDYVQVKSSVHDRACLDESHISHGVAATLAGYSVFIVCCIYLVL